LKRQGQHQTISLVLYMSQDTNKKQKCKRKWNLSCSNCFFDQDWSTYNTTSIYTDQIETWYPKTDFFKFSKFSTTARKFIHRSKKQYMMETYVLLFATSFADHLSVSYRTLRTWIDLLMTPTGVILGSWFTKINHKSVSYHLLS